MTETDDPCSAGVVHETVKVRFLIIGAWNTVFGILAFAVADVTAGRIAGYAASLTLMFAAAIPQAHLAQRLWVWRSQSPYLSELLRFSRVFVVAYVVNLVILTFAVEVLEVPTLGAQAAISCVLAVSTFFVHRTWTFLPSRE